MRFLIIFTTILFSVNAHAQKNIKPVADSIKIKSTVTSFYKWYNTNWRKVDAFKLYKGKKGGYNPPYIIDWKEVDRYFAYLKKAAPQLHANFFVAEKEEFKQIQKGFDQNPEEEIAIGFDADRFTYSQEEPQFFIDELKKSRWEFHFKNSSEAIVTLWQQASDARGDYQYQLMCFNMEKIGGSWKIASIYGCADMAE